jgi:hypothetical protein
VIELAAGNAILYVDLYTVSIHEICKMKLVFYQKELRDICNSVYILLQITRRFAQNLVWRQFSAYHFGSVIGQILN